MNTISRRALLGATALVPLALAGCAGQTAAQVSAAIVADLTGALRGVVNTVPGIVKADPTLLSPALQAKVTSQATQGLGVLAAVQTSMAATVAAPALAKAEADLNAVLGALAAVPLIPPPYSLIIAAAAVVAPAIEGYISGVTGAAGAPPNAAAVRIVVHYAPTMTTAQAKAILAAQK